MNIQESPREEIARLAYQLWEERGCPIGSPELDWERAEKALRHDASSDAAAQSRGEEANIGAVEGMDVSAQSEDASRKPDGPAGKSSRRATGRTNEGPRRSTQVR